MPIDSFTIVFAPSQYLQLFLCPIYISIYGPVLVSLVSLLPDSITYYFDQKSLLWRKTNILSEACCLASVKLIN